MVGLSLGGRLQKFHAYRRRWEVVIAVEFDRLVAFRYDLTVPRGFHKFSFFVVVSALGSAYAKPSTLSQRQRTCYFLDRGLQRIDDEVGLGLRDRQGRRQDVQVPDRPDDQAIGLTHIGDAL